MPDVKRHIHCCQCQQAQEREQVFIAVPDPGYSYYFHTAERAGEYAVEKMHDGIKRCVASIVSRSVIVPAQPKIVPVTVSWNNGSPTFTHYSED